MPANYRLWLDEDNARLHPGQNRRNISQNNLSGVVIRG
jgi:hypothetical protein